MIGSFEISSSDLIAAGPRIVGAVLLWTGMIKAAAPATFRTHVAALGMMPRAFLPIFVTASAAVEAALGTALIVGLAPGVTLPASVVLLVVLSAISWWGVDSGKAVDCGCYGGFIQPSIWQSLGLNALFVVLLLAAWITSLSDRSMLSWQVLAVLGITAFAAVLTEVAQRFENRNGRPLIDTNPIKVGAKWRNRWAHNATANLGDEFLVGLLGADCPFCRQWVKLGNAIGQAPSLPPVVGVIGDSKEKIEKFRTENDVRFTIADISPSLMSRLAAAVPTVVHVVSGRIADVWVGRVPVEFVERFKVAYFPEAALQDQKSGTGATLQSPLIMSEAKSLSPTS